MTNSVSRIILSAIFLTGFLFGESRFDSTASNINTENAEQVADSILRSCAERGFPFALLTPQIDTSDSLKKLRFIVDSGTKIDSVKLLFFPSESIPVRLLSRPAGGVVQIYRPDIVEVISNSLETNPYVGSVTVSTPMVTGSEDSVKMVLPVNVVVRRNLFADGTLSWNSGDNRGVVGFLDLDLLNLFRFGESLKFSAYGDKEIQKASLAISVPWFLNTPFSLNGSGAVEVRKDRYGRVETTAGAGYRLGTVWEAGMNGRFYELSDSVMKRNFIGVGLSLNRFHAPFVAGKFDWGTKLSAGSGVLREKDSRMPRSDFSAAMDYQFPVNKVLAFGVDWFAGAVAVSNPKNLHETEKIRIGGVQTVRGYSEHLYSYVGTGYLRSECRAYFSKKGSIFLFGDPAAGVPVNFFSKDLQYLFGYGLGIRIPAGKVNFSLIWARHYREGSGMGRIHVGIRN